MSELLVAPHRSTNGFNVGYDGFICAEKSAKEGTQHSPLIGKCDEVT